MKKAHRIKGRFGGRNVGRTEINKTVIANKLG